jgi:hypothetical protein
MNPDIHRPGLLWPVELLSDHFSVPYQYHRILGRVLKANYLHNVKIFHIGNSLTQALAMGHAILDLEPKKVESRSSLTIVRLSGIFRNLIVEAQKTGQLVDGISALKCKIRDIALEQSLALMRNHNHMKFEEIKAFPFERSFQLKPV